MTYYYALSNIHIYHYILYDVSIYIYIIIYEYMVLYVITMLHRGLGTQCIYEKESERTHTHICVCDFTSTVVTRPMWFI